MTMQKNKCLELGNLALPEFMGLVQRSLKDEYQYIDFPINNLWNSSHFTKWVGFISSNGL